MMTDSTSRLLAVHLLCLALLASCTERTPNPGRMSSSDADTTRVSDGVAPRFRADHVDSVFVPDGYYLIEAVLTPDGPRIGSLELTTLAWADSNGNTSERPRVLHPAVGSLTVSEPGRDDGFSYPCTVAVVSRDSLSVRCSATPAGDLTINGHFLDGGNFANKFAETSKALLAVHVVISKSGQVLHDGFHHLIYYTGD